MTMVKLSEPALYALGMDRPTVNALSHFIRQVGAETGGTPLPEVARQTDALTQGLASLGQVVAALRELLAALEEALASQPPAPALEPPDAPDAQTPLPVVVVAVEALQTELRTIAEQMAVVRAELNELKQGPML